MYQYAKLQYKNKIYKHIHITIHTYIHIYNFISQQQVGNVSRMQANVSMSKPFIDFQLGCFQVLSNITRS